MSDGQVIIDILAEDKEYKKTVSDLNTYTQKSVDVTAKAMMSVGKGMTAAITAPILAIGAFSIKAAIDFESSFAGVRKTTEATEEEFKQLAQDAKDMSETKVVTTNQVNDIMALGSQLGIAKENLTSFTSTIADLDVATNMNAEEASTQIAQYSNITKMAQTDTDRFGSTIVELGNNMATTEADIMSLAMRIAGAGSQVGMTDAEILALSGSLASVGISAEAGGTAISTIMSQIDKDVAQNSNSLKTWADAAGMSTEQFADAWRDNATGALQQLLKGMDDATQSGGNMNLMLDELGISSLRQTDVMKRMSNAADLLGTSVNTANAAWDANNALTKESEARYMTTEAQMSMLQNKMTNVAATAGGPLLASINSLIDGAEPFINVLKDAATGFAEMDDGQRNLIVGAALLVAGLGPVVMMGSKILTMTKSMSEGYKTLSTWMALLTASRAKGAVAAGAEAVATTGDAVAKTADTAATTFLARAQVMLNAAMAANPVMLVLAGVMLLVPAIMMLAGAIGNSEGSFKKLTIASQEQQRTVKGLQTDYDNIVAEHGELSREALAAKDALDKETAAFEASKQTLSEFYAECEKTVEAHQKLKEECDQAVSTADKEAGSIYNLLNQMDALTASYDDGAASQVALKGVMDALGNSVTGLGDAYDAQTGSLKLTAEEIRSIAEAEAGRIQYAARMDEITKLYAAQNDVTMDLAQAELELEAAQTSYNDLVKASNGATAGNTHELTKAADAVKKLEQTQQDNIDTINKLTEQNQRWYDKQTALKMAVQEGGSATEDATEICERYGISIEELISYEEQQAALLAGEALQAQMEYSAAVEDGITKIDEYSSAHSWFQDAMSQSGISSADLAQRLADTGMSVDDLVGKVSSGSEIIKSSFSRMEIDTSHSLSQMQSNLDANTADMNAFANNLDYLMTQAMSETGSAAKVELVQSLAAMGPEQGAGVAAELVNNINSGMPEAFSGMADQMSAQMAAEARIAIVEAGGATAGEVGSAMEPAKTEMGTKGAESGKEWGTKTAEGINQSKPQVETAAKAVAATVSDSLQGAADEAYSIGAQVSAGMARGITDNASQVASAMASVVKSAIDRGKAEADINSPSRKTRKIIGRGLGEGIEYGVLDLSPKINEAMAMVTTKAISAGVKTLDISGFSYDPSDISQKAGAAAGDTTINNYYSIDGMEITGSAKAEAAVDTIFGILERKGRM